MKPFPNKTIVATIGPATHTPEMISGLISAGVGIFRLHMGYDRPEGFHQQTIDMVRSASVALEKEALVLCDLCGPRIRLGAFENDETFKVAEGDLFTFFVTSCLGNSQQAFINYDRLPQEVKVGSVIMVHDGKRKFKVESVTENAVITRVIAGGNIRSNGGVNIIGANLTIPVLTERDMNDIEFGVTAGVDLFAVSFVQKADDVLGLKNILAERGSNAGVIAKIETPEAVDAIDGIIDASDGIMVARGDLAIEIGHEYVPKAQKMIIKKCNEKQKFVIVATDMMDSMKSSPTPTRAEVSDVANAILDGADAVMTSIETVIGDYPIETVTMMRKIIDVYKN